MNTFKKLFSVTAIIALLTTIMPVMNVTASFSDQLKDAYTFAADNGITSADSIDNANMYGSLTRIAMAKMMANFAIDVLGNEADTDMECTFPDVSSALDAQYDMGVTNACQLSLMGVGIDNFNPYGLVTRAEFGTVLSRALYGDDYNGADPYYADHLDALQDAGIMNDISNPMMKEMRGYVMLMMERGSEDTGATEGCSAEELLACITADDYDDCIADCSGEVEEDEDEEVVIEKDGSLDVSMTDTDGRDIPYGLASVEVATYEFEAKGSDIELTSLELEQNGYSDDLTLDGLYLVIDGARVSDVDDIDIDEELELDLTDAYVIKKGGSVEVTVYASVANTGVVNGDQFSIELTNVFSTAEDLDLDNDLESDTFKIVNQANYTIDMNTGSTLDAIVLGEDGADLFEFDIENGDQDAIFESVMFNLGKRDYDDYLENFTLEVDGEEIAEGVIFEDYLTFVIEDGFDIEDDKTETFTVVADYVAYNDTSFTFDVEEALDVVVIGDTYDVPATINVNLTTKTVTSDAGDVSLEKTNPSSKSLIRDRDDLYLGSFEIINNENSDLELQDFVLEFTSNTGTDIIMKKLKAKVGSTSASSKTLDLSGSVSTTTQYSIDSLDKNIGESLKVYLYLDTEDVAMDDHTLRMKLVDTTIVESEDEDEVTDVTPSTLTFVTMKGGDSELTINKISMGNKSVAQGAEGVEALKFTVEAGEEEGAKITELEFFATAGTIDDSTVTYAVLEVDGVDYDADVKVGSIVIYDNIEFDAGEEKEFILKLDIDSEAPTATIYYSLDGSNSITAEDTSDDRNDLTVSTTFDGREITIKDGAEVSIDFKSSNDVNKYDQNILAGEEGIVALFEVSSDYEEVDVETIKVTFTGDIEDSLLDVEVLYGDVVVANNPTWTLTGTVATFENINNFIVLEDAKDLTVNLITKVNNEDNGEVVLEANYVTNIAFEDVYGEDSGDEVTVTDEDTSNMAIFSIVPVTLVAAVNNATSTKADLDLVLVDGNNKTNDNDSIETTIETLVFDVIGNGLDTITIKNSNGEELGSGDGSTPITISGAVAGVFSEGTVDWTVFATTTGSDANFTITLDEVTYGTDVNSGHEYEANAKYNVDVITRD